MKLNIGCGRTPLKGWLNVDCMAAVGEDSIVDIIANLDADQVKLPLEDDSCDEFLLSHVLEHINKPLPLMEELHRIAKPGALAVVRCPYGSSDDAWEDPTHVRPYFMNSFGYFSQPFYWRAQYDTMGYYDVFSNRVHPNPLCPWFLPSSLSKGKTDRQSGAGSVSDNATPRSLLSQEVHEGILREGVLQSTLPNRGNATANPLEKSQWERQIYEGRILARQRSEEPWRKDSGTSTRDGDSLRPDTSSVGECSPYQREYRRQLIEELGTMVQAAASRAESRGLAELARLLVPERIAPNVEIGERGCMCTTADYGYRGDWRVKKIKLFVATPDVRASTVRVMRNTVNEMVAELEAVKPIREPKQELQEAVTVELVTP